MKNIENINRSISEMAIRLASNADLQARLNIKQPLTIQDMLTKHYICIGPQTETNIEKSGRNVFLIVNLQDITFYEEAINARGVISIVADANFNTTTTDYRDRLLDIVNEIVKSLDNAKLSSSITVSISGFSRVNYTELLTGYQIFFDFKDQGTKEVEL